MLPAVAKKVKGGEITTSPGPIPNAFRAIKIASEPLAAPIPYLVFEYFARVFSIFFTFSPFMTIPDSKTAVMAELITSFIK